MQYHHFRTSSRDKEQRGMDHTQERAQQLRFSDQRTQKVTARTQDLYKRTGHLGYGRTMQDLLQNPVNLGLKGEFRGHQR
jgi:hypothetical protein